MSGIESLIESANKISKKHMVFTFANENWHGEILSVQAISEWDAPVNIPHVPVYICGAVALNGTVAPVMDIHQYCGLPHQSVEIKNVAMVKFDDSSMEHLIGYITQSLLNDGDHHGHSYRNDNWSISHELIVGIAIIEYQMVLLMDADKLIKRGLLDESYAHQSNVTLSEGIKA